MRQQRFNILLLFVFSWKQDTGFPLTERDRLGLRGLLPPRVISFEQQYARFSKSNHNTFYLKFVSICIPLCVECLIALLTELKILLILLSKFTRMLWHFSVNHCFLIVKNFSLFLISLCGFFPFVF